MEGHHHYDGTLHLAFDANSNLLLHQTRYCLRPEAVCVRNLQIERLPSEC